MKRLFIALLLSISCSQTNAALVTYNNYTLIEEANIVTAGAIEWLQWDVTRGMSIDTALDIFGTDGWTLATQADMAGLFNDFVLSARNPWDEDENTAQIARDRFNLGDDINTDPELQFLKLFGHTYEYLSPYHVGFDREQYSTALFGEDADGDGLYNIAEVHDDFFMDEAFEAGSSFMDRDLYSATESDRFVGVALVRTVSAVSDIGTLNAVSAPGSALMLLAGLCSLVRLRKNQMAVK